jgi:hypothetical protein
MDGYGSSHRGFTYGSSPVSVTARLGAVDHPWMGMLPADGALFSVVGWSVIGLRTTVREWLISCISRDGPGPWLLWSLARCHGTTLDGPGRSSLDTPLPTSEE